MSEEQPASAASPVTSQQQVAKLEAQRKEQAQRAGRPFPPQSQSAEPDETYRGPPPLGAYDTLTPEQRRATLEDSDEEEIDSLAQAGPSNAQGKKNEKKQNKTGIAPEVQERDVPSTTGAAPSSPSQQPHAELRKALQVDPETFALLQRMRQIIDAFDPRTAIVLAHPSTFPSACDELVQSALELQRNVIRLSAGVQGVITAFGEGVSQAVEAGGSESVARMRQALRARAAAQLRSKGGI
ncbi:hypothetical protein JCM11641_003102 [Rhodosporidiobolus odoratus]